MSIVYFGSPSQLAASFVETVAKEDEDVYFFSNHNFLKGERPKLPYKYYTYSASYALNKEVMQDIQPAVVVFAGLKFVEDTFYKEEYMAEYLADLSVLLELSKKNGVEKFIYLSSLEVYGAAKGIVTEQEKVNPVSDKGRLTAQCEHLVQMFDEEDGMKTAILRISQIATSYVGKAGKGFWGKLYAELTGEGEQLVETSLQPLNCSDLAEAVKRAIFNHVTGIYNVCATESISKAVALKLLEKKLNGYEVEACEDFQEAAERRVDNEAFKHRTEWRDFGTMQESLKGLTINITKANTAKKKTKKLSRTVGKWIEHAVLFSLFAALTVAGKNHLLFSSIEWMTVYIIIVSVYLGTYHSAVSILAALAVYMAGKGISLQQMTNFYTYAVDVLRIVEYIFIGGIVSYVTESLREKNRLVKAESLALENELKELKKINKENVLIKQEYEKRLLDSKDSLNQVYHIINRLNVLQPERIMMEILKVVSEMMNAKTVAAYRAQKESSFLRLSDALGSESVFIGKSWDLKKTPRIWKKLQKNEIFLGNEWEDEPAMVAPVSYNGTMIAAIVILEIGFAERTLHQVNLLRTLSILMAESLNKALEYEALIRSQKYINGTNILYAEEFEKSLLLAQEKRKEGTADYCVIKIESDLPYQEVYPMIEHKFRNMDTIGLTEDGMLRILLNNSNEKEGEQVIQRIVETGLNVEVVI